MAWTFYNAQGHVLPSINVATDAIWAAAGDLAQGTGVGAAERLPLGAVGTVVRSTGSANAYAFPPGHELDYVENTTLGLSVTATTEATAQVIVTSSSVTFDGSPVWIEGYAPFWNPNPTAGPIIVLVLWDNTAGASIGKAGVLGGQSTSNAYGILYARRRITPASGARVYSWRAYVSGGTGSVTGGAGGVGNYMPGYMRIAKAT